MMGEHIMTLCKMCDIIIDNCRCPSLNKKKVYKVCDACKQKAFEEQEHAVVSVFGTFNIRK